MELHNHDSKEIQGIHTVSIPQDQYIAYTNQISTFDPNLSSAAQYSSPPPSSYTSTEINQRQVHTHHATGNLITATTEYGTNCVTYSNVIFVPTITNNERTDQSIENVETMKNEVKTTINSDEIEPHSYKYIVSSDPRFTNIPFIRNGDEIGDNSGMEVSQTTGVSINGYIEQPSHMITSVSNAAENERILNNQNHMNVYDGSNAHHSQHHQHHQMQHIDAEFLHEKYNGTTDSEIILQGANGQFYRHVQNIYVNHSDAANSMELIPAIISEAMVTDTGYSSHESYLNGQLVHGVSYEMRSNLGETLCTSNKTIDQGLQNVSHNSVELIYGNYKDCSQPPLQSQQHQHQSQGQYTLFEPINRNNVIHENSVSHHQQLLNENNCAEIKEEMKPNYQLAMPLSLVEKDQQRILLESTMSPLLAAVSAREEQFQLYHNDQNQRIDNHSIQKDVLNNQCTIQPTSNNTITTTSTITTKDFLNNNCENTRPSSPSDEYVDINEMEFIEPNNRKGSKDENLLMRRSQRKMKKTDELMVVDKHVPSRAWASLPTSYLFIGNCTDDPTKHTIFAKKDIPLRTKFGPFEGDTTALGKAEIVTYKTTRTKLPLLFVAKSAILDVSNEKTSNWMRFVYLATKYIEQNLLLYEVDSKLFFKSCQFIAPKTQLRVGYSKEYAEKYSLPLLVPDDKEKEKIFEKQNPWLCFKCDKRFSSSEKLQAHLIVHDTSNSTPVPVIKALLVKSNETEETTISPVKSKHRLNTGAIRKRKLALSKNSRTSGPTVRYACCYCSKVFTKFLSYKKHTNAVHSVDVENKRFTAQEAQMCKENGGKMSMNKKENSKKWYVCDTCQRYFGTEERLEKHRLIQCNKNDSKFLQCQFCSKRLQTPSALTMHVKTHNAINGIFRCPFCSERYQSTLLLGEHVKIHMQNGAYFCPHCNKEFEKYIAVRKHIKLIHSSIRFKCPECGKDFKTKYKLKEHRLRHSDVRQFLCADCGKQFKRKDKLREHILKIHASNSDSSKHTFKKSSSHTTKTNIKSTQPIKSYVKSININSDEIDSSQDSTYNIQNIGENTIVSNDSINNKPPKFTPKVPPTDYQRFIYKCHDCMLGFKRRGMLVNHMAKRHPDISVNSVPELNLPILKTQRCYYCQYCDKVYKSSSKRKAHILKYHPGQDLPVSTRHKKASTGDMLTADDDPTFSQNIGSVTTHAQHCAWCHKQYASKTRLLQHQRKQHGDDIQNVMNQNANNYFKEHNLMHDHHQHHQHHYQHHQQIESVSTEHHQLDGYKLVNYNEIYSTNEHNSNRFIDLEPENKLLKLSSAALEASIRDDFKFFDNDDDISNKPTNEMVHSIDENTVANSTTLSKVDVNFKVIGNDYVDTSTSSNCDLNPLPQLFEEITCMALKPSHYSSAGENGNNGAQCIRDVESPLKKNILYN